MPQAAHAGFPGRREVDHGQGRRHAFEGSAPAQVSSSRCRGARPRGGLLGRREFEAVIGAVFAISLIRLGHLLFVGLLALRLLLVAAEPEAEERHHLEATAV